MNIDTGFAQEPSTAATPCRASILHVPKMDCPSEESLVRMALEPVRGIRAVKFDLNERTVTIDHAGDAQMLLDALLPLNLGAQLRESVPIGTAQGNVVTTLLIPKMDCPSEENLIRMALGGVAGVGLLDFDLAAHTLRVTHQGNAQTILARLAPFGLGAQLIHSKPATDDAWPENESVDDADEARTLRWLLAINGLMFLVEMAWGLLSESTGLIADSLDMFADAAVYILALYAVGRSVALKRRAAHLAGWLQVILALGAMGEVLHRGVTGSAPESVAMIGIGAVALVANVICLMLIARKRHHGAHMKASYIFSANDVIANLGVVIAGALVTWTGSPYPDLMVGFVISLIVLIGARRILRLQ
ncbi:cation transporter [Rugamonas aquatica]|nr:cation transporter [Rugamonas aquatica]